MDDKLIPFTSQPPSEEGAYWWKGDYNGAEVTVLAHIFQEGHLYAWSKLGFTLLDDIQHGEWSPRLIPITELDEAKKRIGELEDRIQELELKEFARNNQ